MQTLGLTFGLPGYLDTNLQLSVSVPRKSRIGGSCSGGIKASVFRIIPKVS